MKDDDVPRTLDRLRGHGLSEALVLSTCNRVEVYGVGGGEPFDVLCDQHHVDPARLKPFVYTKTAGEAVLHCFRVASSLDSMVVGEPQILGQVKHAFEIARHCQTAGPLLHRVMNQAFTVAKKVRTATAIGQHPVSVPSVAVELAEKVFEDLRERTVLLIGAGEMGELAAKHFKDRGATRLIIANRTWDRAVARAEALSATAIAFERLDEGVADADIVITATGASHPVITREAVQVALGRRRSRPLLLIDIAVPHAVEPGTGDLDGVFCYDIDDLRHVASANACEREREAAKAEALVEREADKFMSRLQSLAVAPTITSLREQVETIRRAELAKTLSRLETATPEARAAIEAMSTALVNKILHEPTVKLREASQTASSERWAALVAELFGLDPAPG